MTPADYPLSEPGPYQVGVLPLATKDPTRGNRPVDITYRRQQTDEVGHAVLGSITKFSFKRRRRAFLIPLVVLVLGSLLALWGPLPGLGMVHMVRQEKKWGRGPAPRAHQEPPYV